MGEEDRKESVDGQVITRLVAGDFCSPGSGCDPSTVPRAKALSRRSVDVPLVSVIVPSFQQGRFLREALESVLEQDHRPLEVLVLDGGSTDETPEILRSYTHRPEVWWRSHPDAGVVSAVNEGLSRARGDIALILSSDDALEPGAIGAGVAALEANSDVAFVYADARYIDGHGRDLKVTNVGPYSLARFLARRTFVIQSSAFFRLERARAVGGWRAQFSYVADNDLWLRMALRWPVLRIPGVWSRYRFHDAQRDVQGQRIIREWNSLVQELTVALPRPVRRAARVGCRLTEYRYVGADHWWRRTGALYAAVATDPHCLTWDMFPRRELLQPLRQVLSRGKRSMLRVLRSATLRGQRASS